MTWGAVAVGTVTALGSAYSANQQQKQQAENDRASMMANAAQIENSPWTGVKSAVQGPTAAGSDALGAAVQGGLQGAMFGSQLGKNAGEAKIKKDAAASYDKWLESQKAGAPIK